MPVRAKEFRYEVALDRAGRFTSEDCEPLEPGESWTADHLLLAALVRCTLTSLRFHAQRREIAVDGSGRARGLVTRRDEDGRYALVDVDCELEVELTPAPPDETATAELLALAERDCFIGASLRASPRYRWTVNSVPAAPS